MIELQPDTLAKLRQVGTSTLTTQLFKRGFRNVFVQGVSRLGKAARSMVGEAFTLRYIPAREDLDPIDVLANPEHPQRKAIEVTPPGHVLVMDCRKETRAASAGHILLTRLQVRGVAGVVSDGCMRDSGAIAEMDFPVYCAGAAAPLNLVCHHAVDINVPIACGDVAVFPGDVLVGDADGVVVIPRHLADEVARDTVEQDALEEFVLREIRSGKALAGTYPPNADARARFEEWRARGKIKH